MEQLEISEIQTQGFEVKKLDTDDFLSSDQMNWSITLCMLLSMLLLLLTQLLVVNKAL